MIAAHGILFFKAADSAPFPCDSWIRPIRFTAATVRKRSGRPGENVTKAAATQGQTPPQTGTPSGKRPYERPRILHREPLEVMAAVCAPHPPAKGNPGVCPQGPISS